MLHDVKVVSTVISHGVKAGRPTWLAHQLEASEKLEVLISIHLLILLSL